jgi:hypothetical protein
MPFWGAISMPRKRNQPFDIVPGWDSGLHWCLPDREWLKLTDERAYRSDGSRSSSDWRSVRRKTRAFTIAQTLANRSGYPVEVSQRVKRRGKLLENVWILEPRK